MQTRFVQWICVFSKVIWSKLCYRATSCVINLVKLCKNIFSQICQKISNCRNFFLHLKIIKNCRESCASVCQSLKMSKSKEEESAALNKVGYWSIDWNFGSNFNKVKEALIHFAMLTVCIHAKRKISTCVLFLLLFVHKKLIFEFVFYINYNIEIVLRSTHIGPFSHKKILVE